MTIVSEKTGEQAFLRVRRKFSLTGPQSPSVNRQEGREQPISLTGNSAEVEYKPRPPESRMAPSSSDNDPLPGLIRFAEWAEDAIAEQRKDIGRISTVVSKIEKEMRSFKDFMIETRRDLATVPGGKPWASMKRSVTLLEEEVGSIRTELETRPGTAYLHEDDGVKLSVEELDVLTTSITKISQKVNEVESLKMELQFMKTRLKRFEEASRTVKQAAEPPARGSPPIPVANMTSDTPRLPSSVRRIVEPRTTEHLPEAPPNPNSNRKQVQGIVRGASTEWDYTKSPMSKTSPRKRKSEEYESDPALEMPASVLNNQKKGKPLKPTLEDPNHKAYWKMNHKPKPSRLSNVENADEIHNSLDPDLPSYAEKFTDGNYSSEGDHRPPASAKEREYESAPESRPGRRKPQPARQNNKKHNTRDSSTPEEASPPRRNPRLQALQRTKTSTRRRAYSEGLRNADGVRLTKNGTPDRRGGNYKYLKQYREKMKAQKEQEQGGGQEGDSGGANIMLSVEAETAQMRQEEEVARLEMVKQAELEAREHLVRETLERELGS
jgi:hypothetical protein